MLQIKKLTSGIFTCDSDIMLFCIEEFGYFRDTLSVCCLSICDESVYRNERAEVRIMRFFLETHVESSEMC